MTVAEHATTPDAPAGADIYERHMRFVELFVAGVALLASLLLSFPR